jgi:hypothetical protein
MRHGDVSTQPGASIFRVNRSGFLFYSLTLNMEKILTFETSDPLYRRRRITEKHVIHGMVK